MDCISIKDRISLEFTQPSKYSIGMADVVSTTGALLDITHPLGIALAENPFDRVVYWQLGL
jgi:hypothetical protein